MFWVAPVYGLSAVSPATSRSSVRTVDEPRAGLPVTSNSGAVSACTVNGVVAVRDRHALPVTIQAGVSGQDVVRRVRDQRRVVVGKESPIVLEEVQQIWHQLEIGWHVGVVPEEVHIVECELNDVLNSVAEPA